MLDFEHGPFVFGLVEVVELAVASFLPSWSFLRLAGCQGDLGGVGAPLSWLSVEMCSECWHSRALCFWFEVFEVLAVLFQS